MDKKSQLRLLYSLIITSLFSIFLIYSFAGGDGSFGSPYQISDCTELQNMSSCLSCNYTLISDVDCNGFDYGDGKGFMPVGNCTGVCGMGGDDYLFIGNFNGQNNEISNLFINRTSINTPVALFGFTENSIFINISMINVEIYGINYVGSLIGNSNGESINNVYVNGNIKGSSNYVGILGGKATGIINNSYSKGDVSGIDFVGGLIGGNSGNIINSYSIANVNGSYSVGGLTGFHTGEIINNSYSIGNVSGSSSVGGLIGENDATITNSMWLNTSSNINNSCGSGTTTGVTTTDTLSYFYDCSNEPMNSWDEISTWTCTGTDFPQLTWAYIPPTQQSSSSGSSSIFPVSNFFILISIVLGIFLFN